jgi:hypothetical protein
MIFFLLKANVNDELNVSNCIFSADNIETTYMGNLFSITNGKIYVKNCFKIFITY